MTCNETKDLIHAWLDHEVDPVRSAEIEAHLTTCPACQRNSETYESLRTVVAGQAAYFAAPPAVNRKVRSALRNAARAEAPPALKWIWLGDLNWSRLFAPIAVAGLAVLGAVLLGRPSDQELWAQAVVSAEVRSLMPNHLTDVLSSDQHTVKPWFNGKLDYSPPVVDLTAQGFPLVGARLDYLRDHRISVLVYKHGNHFINLFIWPTSARNAPETTLRRQGYHIVHWVQSGMDCWAASEIRMEDLQEFARLFQAAAEPTDAR
jgi:anti-sigma factor RsiW